MDHIYNKFKVKINDIIETLTSKRNKFLKPKDFDSKTLAKLEWTINLESPKQTLKPTNSIVYRNRSGNQTVISTF